MKHPSYILFAISLLLFGSCTEKIDLPLDDISPKLVVDAQLSDSGYQYIYLSKTSSYYQTDSAERVQNAQIRLFDQNNNTWLDFEETKAGIYQSTDTLTAEVNHCYRLDITLPQPIAEHTRYSSQTCLAPKINLSSATFKRTDNIFNIASYVISIDYTDPANQQNYYFCSASKNRQSITPNFKEISIFDDISFDGQNLKDLAVLLIDLKEHPEYELKPGDTLSVHLNSINESYFNFLLALRQLDAEQNPLIGGPPANAPTNISPEAVGFFSISSVSTFDIVVE